MQLVLDTVEVIVDVTPCSAGSGASEGPPLPSRQPSGDAGTSLLFPSCLCTLCTCGAVRTSLSHYLCLLKVYTSGNAGAPFPSELLYI